MKNSIFILFLLCSFVTFSQVKLQGLVKNSKTNEPIPFCAIAFKGSPGGCLSNEEGIFLFLSSKSLDSLVFNCIGYQQKTIALNDITKSSVVYLTESAYNLQEVVIYDKDDFLFDIFETCRANLVNSKEKEAKTYYVLQSSIANQPVEFLECYYNSLFNASTLRSLEFKNGRVGLAPYNERFFVNANISKVFISINLIGGNPELPANPFEYTKRKLRKYYRLKLLSVSENESNLYRIAFTPIDNDDKFFGGELWIGKEDGLLKKISLEVNQTKKHPFLPLFKDAGSIEHVSMQINKTYQTQSNENVLDHIDFNYQIQYQHKHVALANANSDTSFLVSCKGLMYFYDIDKPFVLPYFEYNSEFSDYTKIAALSYNEDFWTSNTSMEYSQKMKEGLMYFKKNGVLLNFKNGQTNNSNFFKGGKFFENNYIVWSDTKRISLKKDKIINDTTAANSVNGQKLRTQLYQLKAQVFLDLNPGLDSIQHYSATIFDVNETFYNLPEEPVTNCFINIYFDLYEIERRKMEAQIAKNKLTLAEFDALYMASKNNIKKQTADYLSEVERGNKKKALEKWNEFVRQNLGIDNMAIFQIK